MSAEIPTEYFMLQKKFGMEMHRALGDNMAGFYILGSSSGFQLFPGVSDINFYLVLNDNLSSPLGEVSNKISEIVNSYKTNPMFTTLMNMTVLFQSGMPDENGLNGFSPLRALALKHAMKYSPTAKKFVKEENDYGAISVKEADVKLEAKKVVLELISNLIDAQSEPNFDDEFQSDEDPNLYLAIESILLGTQVYFMSKHLEYRSKVELNLEIEEEGEDLDSKLVEICINKRQGADYIGSFVDSEDDDIVDSGKESGVIHKLENATEDALNFLSKVYSKL